MAKKLILASFYCLFASFLVCRAQTTIASIYVFGDSLVDVGNNNHLPLSLVKANFPYNGVDFSGNKATGRFSNGKNAADFLGNNHNFQLYLNIYTNFYTGNWGWVC